MNDEGVHGRRPRDPLFGFRISPFPGSLGVSCSGLLFLVFSFFEGGNDEDGEEGFADEGLGDGAEEDAADGAVTVGADDAEIDAVFAELDDRAAPLAEATLEDESDEDDRSEEEGVDGLDLWSMLF